MPRACLRPQNRLHHRREFDRVFAQPRRWGDRYLTILTRANPGPCARLGLVVSKRVDKRAVGRNRIKRLVRETFRRHAERLGPLDVVVIPRPLAAQLNNRQLLDALSRLFDRLGPPTESD